MKVLQVDFRAKNAPELFCQSLKHTGFGVLTNHPISTNLIDSAYTQWRDFFASEEKFNYRHQKPSQDGYFPFRTENAKDAKVSDLKEFYHFYTVGKQPPALREITQALTNELTDMACVLLQWIEDHLPDHVSKQLSMPLKSMIRDSQNTVLRILHYPPLNAEIEEGAIRAAAHEDIDLLTLLPAATAPGLEVKDVNGNWHAVPCDQGNIVVNVGDMLQMATQNNYKSTTHRVVNPGDTIKNESRYSMPLFFHPRSEVKLSETYTANEYLTERLRQIGIY